MSDLSRMRSIGINVFLIVTAATILYSQLSSALDTRAAALRPGDNLPPLAGIDFSTNDRTLVIAVRAGCPFAEHSMPFYRRIAELKRRRATTAGLAVVSPDSEGVSRNLLRIHDVDIPAAPATPLSSLKLHWTPTLVLANRAGIVLRVWEGELSPAAQSDVLAAIGVPGLERTLGAAEWGRR